MAICNNLSFVARLSVKVPGNGKNVHTYIGPVSMNILFTLLQYKIKF